MTTATKGLEALGWHDGFDTGEDAAGTAGYARVAAVDRDRLLLLLDAEGPFRAALAGRFRLEEGQENVLPCVGDWVLAEKGAAGSVGVIQALCPRRTALRRRAAGIQVAFQMIAANVDAVVIVQSCHFDFNPKRLERYLVMVRDGGAEPWVLLTKTDLVDADSLAVLCDQVRATGYDGEILTLSNVTQEGLAAFRERLEHGNTYCFVGSSGVGKSTLINLLCGEEQQKTLAVSATGEGRHTTVRRELLVLGNGALVIDTPGMREFGLMDADEGLAGSFQDIEHLARTCRFSDCRHESEPGCAVQAALASGELDRLHFRNYLKLQAESAHYKMSYTEQRQKGRAFSRKIRSGKKKGR